jgi:hypothetical protein
MDRVFVVQMAAWRVSLEVSTTELVLFVETHTQGAQWSIPFDPHESGPQWNLAVVKRLSMPDEIA